MKGPKRQKGLKSKKPIAETMDFQITNPIASSSTLDIEPTAFSSGVVEVANNNPPSPSRRGRGRPRKSPTQSKKPHNGNIGSPSQRNPRTVENNGVMPFSSGVGEISVMNGSVDPIPKWESAGKVVPSMDAVVKVFCVHTEPNFSLPWQRKRQYSSSSSGFVIGGKRVLTNAHSVEHYTQVKLKKRGSDTKYLARVLAIGTECDIGEKNVIVLRLPFFIFILLSIELNCVFDWILLFGCVLSLKLFSLGDYILQTAILSI